MKRYLHVVLVSERSAWSYFSGHGGPSRKTWLEEAQGLGERPVKCLKRADPGLGVPCESRGCHALPVVDQNSRRLAATSQKKLFIIVGESRDREIEGRDRATPGSLKYIERDVVSFSRAKWHLGMKLDDAHGVYS